MNFVVENSNEISGMYLINDAYISQIAFNNVTIFNNSQGGIKIFKSGTFMMLDVASCNFSQNSNGALSINFLGGRLEAVIISHGVSVSA